VGGTADKQQVRSRQLVRLHIADLHHFDAIKRLNYARQTIADGAGGLLGVSVE
jgi:hypothetical protein